MTSKVVVGDTVQTRVIDFKRIGIKPHHRQLCSGAGFKPFAKSGIAQSLGPLTQLAMLAISSVLDSLASELVLYLCGASMSDTENRRFSPELLSELGIPHGRYRELASAGVPGPSSYDCAPTAAAPRNDSSASPAKGVHRVRSVRRRKLSSTSCCSVTATTTSAVNSSVFTAAWDFHT
ncbi:hypothetical protein MTO96_017763 [Rhipicephalus appendiculatus]